MYQRCESSICCAFCVGVTWGRHLPNITISKMFGRCAPWSSSTSPEGVFWQRREDGGMCQRETNSPPLWSSHVRPPVYWGRRWIRCTSAFANYQRVFKAFPKQVWHYFFYNSGRNCWRGIGDERRLLPMWVHQTGTLHLPCRPVLPVVKRQHHWQFPHLHPILTARGPAHHVEALFR